jgi:peptide/nickel transport system substrate-binding protein
MSRERIHPMISEARQMLRDGSMSRRDFLRLSSLLGLSVAGASALAACGGAAPTEAPTEAPAATAAPTVAPTKAPTVAATEAATEEAATGGISRGGTLTVTCRVDEVDNPARFSLVSQSHPWRQVAEYLTYTDPGGITHPHLLESWEASDDLLTWTLKLRKGIKFNNGEDLTADDVIWNFGQWLSEDVGSSMLGILNYLDPDGQEKVDDYTIVCHLNKPSIALPEHLYNYPALIMPKDFGGDIAKEPIGTGPFTMEEFVPGERCRLKARDDYWGVGADGGSLPYVDEIVMVALGNDPTARMNALRAGEVDMILEPPVSVWEGLDGEAGITIVPTSTSATRVLRVRVDQEPWTDNRVRQALKYCHNREKILAVALRNQGVIGNDSHVAPVMPAYCDVAPFPFDTEKAKALLAEAGYPEGLDVELSVASDWPESMAYAQALKEDAAAAGFNITLNTMPATQYWDGWTDFNMGITWWAHRTLSVMILAAAYTSDADGNPVPWNESHWVDAEFEELLHQAEATLDVDDRREIMCKIEEIMKDRGPICTPFFMNVWSIFREKVHGVVPSPEEYAELTGVWVDPNA